MLESEKVCRTSVDSISRLGQFRNGAELPTLAAEYLSNNEVDRNGERQAFTSSRMRKTNGGKMPCELNVNREAGIIELRSFGSVSKAEVIEVMKEVVHLSTEIGIVLLLVDSRQTSAMPNTIDMFDVTSKFPRAIKMAILVSEDNELMESYLFGETVGVNRGIPIRVFISESEALEWLKS